MQTAWTLPLVRHVAPVRLRPLARRTITVIVPSDGGDIAVKRANALAQRAYDVTINCAASAATQGDLVLRYSTAPAEGSAPTLGRDPRVNSESEAYEFSVRNDSLVLDAASEEAAFRALLTLAAAVDSSGGDLPLFEAVDSPRFAWRGLSLDVVRHWFSVDEVEQVIDLLAVLKMNVLHLHLSDTQAWRIEVPGYPQLTANQEHYSASDLDRLVAYAKARYVTLVPEIDLPGHTAAVAVALPEIAPGPFPHPIATYLDWATPGVAPFITSVLAELTARFDSRHIHIGGDEAFGMPQARYVATVREIIAVVRALGRIPLGWQEVSRACVLGSDDLVQLWIADLDRFDTEAVKKSVASEFHELVEQAGVLFAEAIHDPRRASGAGVPLLVSSSDPLYLDRRPSEPSRCDQQNENRTRLGHPGYPATPSLSVLEWEPTLQRDILEAQASVAGIEAALWCESVTSFDDAAQLLLPRLALVAHRAWSTDDADTGDVIAAARAQAPAWERLGFTNFYRSEAVFA